MNANYIETRDQILKGRSFLRVTRKELHQRVNSFLIEAIKNYGGKASTNADAKAALVLALEFNPAYAGKVKLALNSVQGTLQWDVESRTARVSYKKLKDPRDPKVLKEVIASLKEALRVIDEGSKAPEVTPEEKEFRSVKSRLTGFIHLLDKPESTLKVLSELDSDQLQNLKEVVKMLGI
jgi:hypothetical protein